VGRAREGDRKWVMGGVWWLYSMSTESHVRLACTHKRWGLLELFMAYSLLSIYVLVYYFFFLVSWVSWSEERERERDWL
jgi:hypothetical protein